VNFQEKLMSLRNRLTVASVTLLFSAAPSFSHSQSLSDLLRLVPQGASANNLLGAVKSLSEITQGHVEPGTGPENADGKIILYRTVSCPYCKRAAAYMQMKNIGFVERDIEKNSGYKAEFTRLGGVGVPLLVFREKTMSGFNETAFERNYGDFKRSMESSPNPTAAAPATSSSSSGTQAIQPGDVLVGKISGINVYVQPAKSERLTVLGKADEVIYMGEERDGRYRVTTQKGEGWIDKLLVKKQ
jgi:glutaredoxin